MIAQGFNESALLNYAGGTWFKASFNLALNAGEDVLFNPSMYI